MTESLEQLRPPLSFWAVATGSLLWNLIGLMNFVMTMTISPDALTAMSEAEQSLYTDIPPFVTVCFAVAVFAGVAASVLLLMRRAICVSVFLVSLFAVLLQTGAGLLFTPLLAVQGIAGLALPVLIILLAAVFLGYSRRAAAAGLLH